MARRLEQFVLSNFVIEEKNSPIARRLRATAKLNAADFDAIASELRASPIRARKIGFVAARRLTAPATIETRWNGKETEVSAAPGDWIVANMNAAGELLRDSEGHLNEYAIRSEKFDDLYAPHVGTTEAGLIFRALSEVDAIYFPGGFDILAPWGETQRAAAGYILRNRNEVYGNHKDTFEATYEVIP